MLAFLGLNLIIFNCESYIVKEQETPQKVENDTLVNNTVIYQKVDLDDGTLFIGSDDTWIYAVSLSTGKIMWKTQTREDTGYFLCSDCSPSFKLCAKRFISSCDPVICFPLCG